MWRAEEAQFLGIQQRPTVESTNLIRQNALGLDRPSRRCNNQSQILSKKEKFKLYNQQNVWKVATKKECHLETYKWI
jgi:hypothetical protein